MKRLYYLIIAGVVGASSLNAQTVELRETQGGSALATGTNITVVGYHWQEAEKYIYAVNTSGQTEEVNMTRYEISVQPGTENYYCWGICPASASQGTYPEWESPVPLNMDPGVEYDNFHGNHIPNGMSGQNVYRFTWFLTQNRQDTNSVDITFDVAVGVDEAVKNLKVMAYPNPATDYLQFNFDQSSVDGNDIRVSLYNMIGEEVQNHKVNSTNLRLDVKDEARGIYFYAVTVNGTQALTKKVILN